MGFLDEIKEVGLINTKAGKAVTKIGKPVADVAVGVVKNGSPMLNIAKAAKSAIRESIEEADRRQQEFEDGVNRIKNAKNEPWFTGEGFLEDSVSDDEKLFEFAVREKYRMGVANNIVKQDVKLGHILMDFTQDKLDIADRDKEAIFHHEMKYYESENVFDRVIRDIDPDTISDFCVVSVYQKYTLPLQDSKYGESYYWTDFDATHDPVRDILNKHGFRYYDYDNGHWKVDIPPDYVQKQKEAEKFKKTFRESRMTKSILSSINEAGDKAYAILIGLNGMQISDIEGWVITDFRYRSFGYPDLDDMKYSILMDYIEEQLEGRFEYISEGEFQRIGAIKDSW